MKIKFSFLSLIIIGFFIFSSDSFAEGSGSCSSHGGVNCSLSDFKDGSVICNDGWRNSSVMFEDVNKCSFNNDKCFAFDDIETNNSVSKYWSEEIDRIKKTQTELCKSNYESKINFASSLEKICINFEESKRVSAIRSGKDYVTKNCTETSERDYAEKYLNNCTGSIDVNENILKAKNRLFCIEYKQEILVINERYMKSYCPKIGMEWSSTLKICTPSLVNKKDTENEFAKILGKAFKDLNSKQISTTTLSATTTTRNITKSLQLGSKGEEVKNLQIKLNLTPTGFFGNVTKQAVIRFQKENNLPQTGFVGLLTRNKLNSSF